MTRIAAALIAIVAASSSVAVWAQTEAGTETAPTPSPENALSLDKAVEIMLAESEDLKTAILTVESVALTPQTLDGAYDWNGQADLGVRRDEAPRTSSFEPQTITTVPLSASLSRLFPSGTYVEASLSASYFDAPFDLPFPIEGQIERGWRQGVTLTARHPLWGTSQTDVLDLQREEIEKNVVATAAQVAEGVEQGVAGVHRLFWGWVLAEEAVHVANASVESAEELRDLVARRVRRGMADERDLLLTEAGVQQAKLQVVGATRGRDAARRSLLDLMGVAPDAFDTVSYDVEKPVTDVDADALTGQGVASSLALRTLEAQRDATEVAQLRVREQMKGGLSAVASVSQEALFPNGTGLDDDVGYIAFGGVRYTQTFGNAGRVTEIRQREIDRRRIESQIARKKQQIRAAAGEHTAAIASARTQIEEAQKLLDTARRRYETEQRNFSIGRIPLRDLVDARNMVVNAEYNLALARVSLQQAATERSLLDGSMTAAYRMQILKDLQLGGGAP